MAAIKIEDFDLAIVTQLYEACPEIIINGKIAKDISTCQAYIKRFLFPMRHGGGYMLLEEGKFMFKETAELKNSYFRKVPKAIGVWFFDNYLTMFKKTYDVMKPALDLEAGLLNLCPGFLWKVPKKYVDYPLETRKKVDLFLSYMKEVLCSDSQSSFEYLVKWYACVCQGKKNKSLLYYKGVEGTGKSTMLAFICEFVLGEDLCIIPSVECLTGSFNNQIAGKVLVAFEELPTFSSNQWEGVSAKLKEMITGKTMSYRDLFEKPYSAPNINNYVINTNVDAIKHSQGRRYFIADVSTKRMGDHAYFEKLRDTCFNNEVGEAFFHYLRDVDTSKFEAQKNMPDTAGKLAAIADRLEQVYQFIKFEYVMKNKAIFEKTTSLYAAYKNYCLRSETTPLSNHRFYAKMADVQINSKKINGISEYRITKDMLLAISNKLKWVHALDLPEVQTKPALFSEHAYHNEEEDGSVTFELSDLGHIDGFKEQVAEQKASIKERVKTGQDIAEKFMAINKVIAPIPDKFFRVKGSHIMTNAEIKKSKGDLQVLETDKNTEEFPDDMASITMDINM